MRLFACPPPPPPSHISPRLAPTHLAMLLNRSRQTSSAASSSSRATSSLCRTVRARRAGYRTLVKHLCRALGLTVTHVSACAGTGAGAHSGARRSLGALLSRQAPAKDGSAPSIAVRAMGSASQQADKPSGRSAASTSDSQHGSGQQLASPGSPVEDDSVDLPLPGRVPRPVTVSDRRWNVGEAASVTASTASDAAAPARLTPPGVLAAAGRLRASDGAHSSVMDAPPDSPASCSGGEQEAFEAERQRDGTAGGRLRGEDRLEALAAVLAAAEAGAGDGAEFILTVSPIPMPTLTLTLCWTPSPQSSDKRTTRAACHIASRGQGAVRRQDGSGPGCAQLCAQASKHRARRPC